MAAVVVVVSAVTGVVVPAVGTFVAGALCAAVVLAVPIGGRSFVAKNK